MIDILGKISLIMTIIPLGITLVFNLWFLKNMLKLEKMERSETYGLTVALFMLVMIAPIVASLGILYGFYSNTEGYELSIFGFAQSSLLKSLFVMIVLAGNSFWLMQNCKDFIKAKNKS